MTTPKPKSSAPLIQNPRYQGATPKDAAKALLRQWGAPLEEENPSPDSDRDSDA